MTTQRTIKGIKRVNFNHLCESPSCLAHARWQIAFSTGERLLLCAQHKDATVKNYKGKT